jgi:ubiquinone/menaquinone biosynthesis C-methylase UbiE
LLLRKIYYSLSPSLRRLVRRLYFFPSDFINNISGTREPLVPPKGKIFTGPGDFIQIGDDFLKNFIELCELKLDARVLDVGCGIGRIARPLTKYLSSSGSYDGFDIVRDGIEWCQKAYREFPSFHFKYIPLRNDLYNLSTEQQASAFRFPYPDQQFDLVILTSVFTHMQEDEVKNYLHEISRVMKNGAHCFCSFFLITNESESYLTHSAEPFFKHRYENYFLHNDKVKDANIAYRYEFITSIINECDLKIKNYFPGYWAGRSKSTCLSFQDILIIKKLST